MKGLKAIVMVATIAAIAAALSACVNEIYEGPAKPGASGVTLGR